LLNISDHLPIFCTVETSVKQQNGHYCFRDYSKFNTESYLQDTCAIDGDVIFGQSNNFHEATARTIGTLKSLVKKHAPLKSISRNKQSNYKNLGLQKQYLHSLKLNMLCTKPTTYLKTQAKLVNLKTTQVDLS